ncbi:MAG TPA: DNA glycosylase [Clostridia bacterium]|nr:DNA glycosylase [Clostridia bacterium]
MLQISYENRTLTMLPSSPFNLARSCACGQAFRFVPKGDGFFGVVNGRGVMLTQTGNALSVYPCEENDIPALIRYFDMERDYGIIEKQIRADERLKGCLDCASGIRIFNQDPFETLISFILSANNNVKRIQKIVTALCETAGELVTDDVFLYHRFPTPAAIAKLSEKELRELGTGYRAPFLRESARMVAEGFDLAALRDLPLFEARRALQIFPGVGAKVADCVLLFSLSHTDAFPMDVWMKRAMRMLFFDGAEPKKAELEVTIQNLGPVSGILQQYVFHYAREKGIGV